MYIVDASLKGQCMLLQWGIVLDHRPVRSDGLVATGLLGGGGVAQGYMPRSSGWSSLVGQLASQIT